MRCKVEKIGVDPMSNSPNYRYSSDELCSVYIAPHESLVLIGLRLDVQDEPKTI